MNFKFKFVVPTLLILAVAGCSSPRERCISGSKRDYQNLLSLISEAEGNIARGYAVFTQTVPVTTTGVCTRKNPYTLALETYPCPQTNYQKTSTPVAIDVKEERSKLQRYQKSLPQYRARLDSAIMQCREIYPEG